MGLEEAIKEIKEVFPLWKPWTYNKRKRALTSLEQIAEKYNDDVLAHDFIGHAVRIGAVRESRGWDKGLAYTFNRLEVYEALDPALFALFGQDRDSIGLYGLDILSSELLPALLQSYKTEFKAEAMYGLTDGLLHAYRRAKGYPSAKIFESDVLRIFQRAEVKQVLTQAKVYGSHFIYAMAKALGQSCEQGLSWSSADFTQPFEQRLHLLETEEAQKVYALYKDASGNVVSSIVQDMVHIALITPHQFPHVTYRWQRPEIQQALAEAESYGKAVEDIIFTAVDRAERYAPLGSKEFSFLSSDYFRELLAEYHLNIPALTKIVENIFSGEKVHRATKGTVFLDPQVQDILKKTSEEKQIEVIVTAFSNEIYRYGSIDTLSAMCAYFQTEDPEKIHAVMEVVGSLRKNPLFERITKKEISLKDIQETIQKIVRHGFISTPYLVAAYYHARDHDIRDENTIVNDWKQTLSSFSEGKFEVANELHRNLEYTRFRRFVDHEKVKKYIKNHFTYEDYEKIFLDYSAQEQTLSPQDAFEVACVVHEARKLYDFILDVKKQADILGRNVVVIPNFSYGYLPVAPLVSHLEALGVDVLIGCKVGSTEAHNNKEVMNSRLFKGTRRKFMNEQPMIIVVDGTQHLVDRGTEDTAARYPDAYQGYLNQVIAMNDALGMKREVYTAVGKTKEDMERLRTSEEFQRAVSVYKNVIRSPSPQPYHFALWNTAEIPLIIRNYHKKLESVCPIQPHDINGPTMIFCNVGLLDKQIPPEIKEQYAGAVHTPAYYDDSGKIIAFDYGFDNFGVRYLNRLEAEVKKAFEAQNGRCEHSLDVAPHIMRYLTKVGRETIEAAT